MSHWKCKRCKHKNEETKKKCGKCNSHSPWKEEDESSLKHDHHNHHNDATVAQDADQVSKIEQESDELIWILNSCNVEVDTTDTQAAVSLQVGLQLAIALVISITLGDSDRGRAVSQELFQKFDDEQTNKQKIFVDNSKDVYIKTTDTDLSVNVQALLQVLVTLVAKIDAF